MPAPARRTRRRYVAVLVSAAAALCFPASASAEGDSFATATPVQYGTPQFGNVAASHCQTNFGFWSLPVTAGDRVSISIQGAWYYGTVFAIGADDYNTDISEAYRYGFKEAEPQSNGKARLIFSAPRTGSMPFVVTGYSCSADSESAGPYDFVATVQHGLRLTLSGMRRRVARRFVATFLVTNPEGVPITDPALLVQLQVKLKGSWVTLGTAPAQAGSAGIAGRLPRAVRGRKVKLRGRAQADGYVTAVSPAKTVRVK